MTSKTEKKFLGIYGAGGFGKEVYDIALDINQIEKRWSDIVFVSDFEENSYLGCDVYKLGDILDKNIELVIAIGEPSTRKKLFERIVSHDLKLATIIDPSTSISPSAVIEEGAIVCQFVTVASNVKIGENAVLHPNLKIGHDTSIGKHSNVCVNATLGGGMTIGECVYVGMGAAALEGLTIADNAILGMGAVLYKNLDKEQVAIGNPARVTKGNDSNKVFKSK